MSRRPRRLLLRPEDSGDHYPRPMLQCQVRVLLAKLRMSVLRIVLLMITWGERDELKATPAPAAVVEMTEANVRTSKMSRVLT